MSRKKIKHPRLPNGFGSIHYLGDKRRKPWRVRATKGYNDNGSPKYEELGCYETYEEAYGVLLEYHKDPFKFKAMKYTFDYVFELWIKEKKNDNINTNKYEWLYRDYCKPLYNMEFINIKLLHLKRIINDMGDKYATKRRARSMFKQIFDFAIANDIGMTNYAEFIKIPIPDDKEEIHEPFTPEEKRLLWANINKVDYVDMVLVYIYTGFRPSELIEIERDTGVNLDEWYLQGGSKTEAGKNRIVPIHPKIRPIIQKWYDMGYKYLFHNNGKKFNYGTWGYRFARVMNTLGLEHIPHDPRHTFSTDLDNVGANKVSRQRLLGHASDDVTDKVYTHKDIEQLRLAIELLP